MPVDLGDVQGTAGSAAIRHAVADALAGAPTAKPSQRSELKNLACATVNALCERDGTAATDIFVTAFQPNRNISRYDIYVRWYRRTMTAPGTR